MSFANGCVFVQIKSVVSSPDNCVKLFGEGLEIGKHLLRVTPDSLDIFLYFGLQGILATFDITDLDAHFVENRLYL